MVQARSWALGLGLNDMCSKTSTASRAREEATSAGLAGRSDLAMAVLSLLHCRGTVLHQHALTCLAHVGAAVALTEHSAFVGRKDILPISCSTSAGDCRSAASCQVELLPGSRYARSSSTSDTVSVLLSASSVAPPAAAVCDCCNERASICTDKCSNCCLTFKSQGGVQPLSRLSLCLMVPRFTRMSWSPMRAL